MPQSEPVRIVWTRHAEERLREWQARRGMTRQEVEAILRDPGQVVVGDLGAQVAQAHHGGGLLRVVFVEEEGVRKVLTLYWTSRVQRYWQE